jgi:mRNA interferase MazF
VKKSGQIVLFRFPQTNMKQGQLRPALLLEKLPGSYDDWLICMISREQRHYIAGFDEIIDQNAPDFSDSGLKDASIIRVGRIAVVEGLMLLGSIGSISTERLRRIKSNLAAWLTNSS